MRSGGMLAAVVFVMLVISGCIGNQQPGGSLSSPISGPSGNVTSMTSVISSSPAGGSPSVFITNPPFDGGILAGNVTIFVEVTNFTLVPSDIKNKPGTGHLIYYRDVIPPAMVGIPAFTQPGTYGASSETSYRWEGITPGTHTFAVQLVNADNTPVYPPVVDAIDVTAVLPVMITNP